MASAAIPFLTDLFRKSLPIYELPARPAVRNWMSPTACNGKIRWLIGPSAVDVPAKKIAGGSCFIDAAN
jgi:hypothetical protein